MEYSYKFRIYPNTSQSQQIRRTFGCCRFVWNHYLTQRIESYRNTGTSPTRFMQDKDLTSLKKQDDTIWLRDVDATALQSSLQHLDTAYQNFFRRVKKGEKPGYPKFKSKRDHRQSYKSKSTSIKVLNGAIQLPKLGKVKCRVSRPVKGRILSATVSQAPSGKYFVALCCTDVDIKPLPSTKAVVGLDMGIKAFATTSDGITYPNPKYLSKSQKKLAKCQRKLSRKTKGSHRWEKARIQVAKLHEHITNQRKDTLHKLSTDLVRNYD